MPSQKSVAVLNSINKIALREFAPDKNLSIQVAVHMQLLKYFKGFLVNS